MTNVDKIVRKWEKGGKRTIAEQVRIRRNTETDILYAIVGFLVYMEFIVFYFGGIKS